MILNKFLERTEYSSYEDLYQNFKLTIPDNFNFAYDVVDEYAKTEPKREALVWCDDNDESHIFTFRDLSIASQRTANFLVDQGIKKGDRVMLILRRRYEFWFFLLALHRIGAIAIPATNMLAAEDLEYRFKAAEVKMIVSYDDPALQKEIDTACDKTNIVEKRVTIGQSRQNWINFYDEYEICPPVFERPSGENAIKNDDIMVVYFTSGTSSNPKMVAHTYTYPLGHIVTAKYWQHVVDGGRHLTVAETGWAKALWGKIYGQWIAGSAVFTYDMKVFIPGKLLKDAGIQGDHLLRAADRLPLHIAARTRQVRPFEPQALHHRWRSPEPRHLQAIPGTDRPPHARRLRPDRTYAHHGQLRLEQAAPGFHGHALSGLPHGNRECRW